MRLNDREPPKLGRHDPEDSTGFQWTTTTTAFGLCRQPQPLAPSSPRLRSFQHTHRKRKRRASQTWFIFIIFSALHISYFQWENVSTFLQGQKARLKGRQIILVSGSISTNGSVHVCGRDGRLANPLLQQRLEKIKRREWNGPWVLWKAEEDESGHGFFENWYAALWYGRKTCG